MINGNGKQRAAYTAIMQLNILSDLKEYNPTLCGTIPIGIDIEGSDLDIIMEVHDLETFAARLQALYKDKEAFQLKRTVIRGKEVVKANFHFNEFEFELFGQAQPVQEQYAYLHMMIENECMKKMPSLKAEIITLKKQGFKTEPAFCKVLGIKGDPYDGLITYWETEGRFN
ncbi:DUF4269 domain-containing protein [Sutcliffiella rhizosphaerae]|nr:DUF4269 domain-containing protein [Sutcliffiella rhizosphaerae]